MLSKEELRKKAKESIPESFRTMAKYLCDRPVELQVCGSLYRTKINSKFGYNRVVRAAARVSNANLSELPELLKDMESKNIISVEQRNGKPDYYLTAVSAEVMDVIETFERCLVPALVEEYPELKKQPREEARSLLSDLLA